MGVTEDDVNEIKQDISSFRFELLDILRNNGMKCGDAEKGGNAGTCYFLIIGQRLISCSTNAVLIGLLTQPERREDFVSVV